MFAYTRDGSIRPEEHLKDALKSLCGTNLGIEGLNVTVICILGIMILLYFAMKKTTLGRNMYVVGDNPEAAKLTGIKTNRMVMIAYILCGICCAIAGIFMSSRAAPGRYIPKATARRSLPFPCA